MKQVSLAGMVLALSVIFSGAGMAADTVPTATETLGGGGRPVGESYSRSPVYGANGMAATAHPLASQAALDVMKAGGSALDGAIAANAALGLMEPTGNGIGGDIYFIIWDPDSNKLYGYNGSGRSPMGRSLEQLEQKIQAMRDAAVKVNPDVIVLCHGGPIAEPEDAKFIFDNTEGIAGFFGASSIERLATEPAIEGQAAKFKALRM